MHSIVLMFRDGKLSSIALVDPEMLNMDNSGAMNEPQRAYTSNVSSNAHNYTDIMDHAVLGHSLPQSRRPPPQTARQQEEDPEDLNAWPDENINGNEEEGRVEVPEPIQEYVVTLEDDNENGNEVKRREPSLVRQEEEDPEDLNDWSEENMNMNDIQNEDEEGNTEVIQEVNDQIIREDHSVRHEQENLEDLNDWPEENTNGNDEGRGEVPEVRQEDVVTLEDDNEDGRRASPSARQEEDVIIIPDDDELIEIDNDNNEVVNGSESRRLSLQTGEEEAMEFTGEVVSKLNINVIIPRGVDEQELEERRALFERKYLDVLEDGILTQQPLHAELEVMLDLPRSLPPNVSMNWDQNEEEEEVPVDIVLNDEITLDQSFQPNDDVNEEVTDVLEVEQQIQE